MRNLKQIFCMMSAMVHCAPKTSSSSSAAGPVAQVDAATMIEVNAPIHNHLAASSSSAGAVAITGASIDAPIPNYREQAARLHLYIRDEGPKDQVFEHEDKEYHSKPHPIITRLADGTWELVDRLLWGREQYARRIRASTGNETKHDLELLRIAGLLEQRQPITDDEVYANTCHLIGQMFPDNAPDNALVFYNGKNRQPLKFKYHSNDLRELPARRCTQNTVYFQKPLCDSYMRVMTQYKESLIRIRVHKKVNEETYDSHKVDLDVSLIAHVVLTGRADSNAGIAVLLHITAKADNPLAFMDLELLYQLLLAPKQRYESLCRNYEEALKNNSKEARNLLLLANRLQKKGKWKPSLTLLVHAFLCQLNRDNMVCPRLYSAVAKALERTR